MPRKSATREDVYEKDILARCCRRTRNSRRRFAGTRPNRRDFYKGKTVTYIVATAPGGGYDLYGRLTAEYMQKYLPGSTFVVKNFPGAGHLIGANTLYASKADGLTIGTFNTGLIYNQLDPARRRALRSHQDVLDRQGRDRSACHHYRRAIADQVLSRICWR